MIRGLRILRIFVITLALVLLFPICVFARAYPEDMKINATVNIDGSMTVEETIVWEIEESINGVYRDILCFNSENKLNSANEIYVESIIVNGEKYYYSEDTLQNGDSGMYNLNRTDDGAQIKIFHPSDDYYVTTVIKYTLTDVIVEYNDIAELYWNFIGTGWASGIENAVIRIELPEESDVLRVFGHGPLNGYSEIIDSKTADFYISYLRSGEAVDARILFDLDIVNASKKVSENAYERIMAEELELAKEADNKRRQVKGITILTYILLVIIIIVTIVTCKAAIAKAKKSKFKGKYYRELPEDYGVPVMNYLLTGGSYKNNENMLATLMDLVRKKYVQIEPIYRSRKTKPYDYKLRLLIDREQEKLTAIEKHYINKLVFSKCGEITLKELKKENQKNMKTRQRAGKALDDWNDIIKREAGKAKLMKKETKMVGKTILILSLCLITLFILVAIGGILDINEIIVPATISLMMYFYIYMFIIVSLANKLKLTEKGATHIEQWKAFKRFLLDFGRMKEKKYDSVVIWEHYLVYAAGLGIAEMVLKELKDIYPEFEQYMSSYSAIYLNPSSFNTFRSSFNTASTGAFSVNSSTGGGGGFSGGSGGRRWPEEAAEASNLRKLYKIYRE